MNASVFAKPGVNGSAGGRSVPAAQKMKMTELVGKEITIQSYKLRDSIYSIDKYAEIIAIYDGKNIMINTSYPTVMLQIKELVGRRVVVRNGYFETLDGEKTKAEIEAKERELRKELRKFYAAIPADERRLEKKFYAGDLFTIDDEKTMIPTDTTKTEESG